MLFEIDENETNDMMRRQQASPMTPKRLDLAEVEPRYQNLTRIQCPSCLRSFGEKAAPAHMQYCQAKSQTARLNSPRKSIANQKLNLQGVRSRIDTGLNSPSKKFALPSRKPTITTFYSQSKQVLPTENNQALERKSRA